MSEQFSWYRGHDGICAVALPFDVEQVIAEWSALRVTMTRSRAPGFERDEWAYLIAFLDTSSLRAVFEQSFGPAFAPTPAERNRACRLAHPRGLVAVWLPNNVSLLGPLTLVLLSLTGNALLMKGGSTSEDLTGAFLSFAREHLAPGPLRDHLGTSITYDVFDRDDSRNASFAARAQVRILFGSDEAARAIDALPHPVDSFGFAFTNRRSEAWISAEVADDRLLEALIKVFAVYGQAGCTSPRRVVIVDSAHSENASSGDRVEVSRQVRDRMLNLWPHVIRATPPAHIASGSILARQWAAALGWDAALTPMNAAVLACGDSRLPEFEAPMSLCVVAASLETAVSELPANIQTIGHAFPDPESPRWLSLLAQLRAKRFVPLARMHHFGPVWDGVDFWRQTFEQVEFRT